MTSAGEKAMAKRKASRMLARAGILITAKEQRSMEVADFGLNQLSQTGLEIVVYVNTDRYCAKELIMLPRQTCPQHRHPSIRGKRGKMETFRCRWGVVYLYIPGRRARRPKAVPPKGKEKCYNVWNEIILKPGDQYTLSSNTWHWFQAGPQGAIVSEFSSTSRDESDLFIDPEIRRTG